MITIDPDGRNGIVVVSDSKKKKDRTVTIKNTYYYTSNPGEKGAITKEGLDYFKNNLIYNQTDLMKTLKHGKVKIDGKKYKLKFETDFVEKDSRAEVREAAANHRIGDFQVGNQLTAGEGTSEGNEYGVANGFQVNFDYTRMIEAFPTQTDGNTPFHEYLHNLGAEHSDGHTMGPTGKVDVTSQSYNGETMQWEGNAPVRSPSLENIQSIINRAASGANKRLKIINE